jgi:hypothetical protein
MVHGSPLIIELSDVVLEAHARPEHEWEEGPALARDMAAKQVRPSLQRRLCVCMCVFMCV